MFAICIPVNHEIYKKYEKSVKNVTLSNLVKEINQYSICEGTKDRQLFQYTDQQVVPKKFNPNDIENFTTPTKYYRSSSCFFISNTQLCTNCNNFQNSRRSQIQKSNKKQEAMNLIPAKPKAPISKTSSTRIKLTLQQYRIENKFLREKNDELQQEICKSSVKVSTDLGNDMVTIMSGADQSKISPFMKFFWEEQQKYLKSSSTGVRYHPMIIRYCLSLAAKSSAAYDEIRYDEKKGTGFLILPSRRRLRDYKNYIKPQRGFNPEIIHELRRKISDFSDIEKFVVLLMDEMKIQENLVWDKHSGELVGYVDLGDIDLNYATLSKVTQVATHVLVFLVRSIVNPFKFSLANFATDGISAPQMFPLLWKAISICEKSFLKVIAVTCDGASFNRSLIKMHFHLTKDDDMNPHVDVTYRTRNLFSGSENRFIYFISDVPHLIKTARNCLSNSGSNKFTRYMWNDGMFLLWNHIADIFYEDQECGLHFFPKLTFEHIKLTPYSVMNVRLAAQVLSSTVSKVLSQYGPPEAAGTAEFCSLFDTFFDIMNIRDIHSHNFDLKPSLIPFSRVDDPRFSWLRNVFLQYFEDWLASIEQRPGNFSKTAKNKMFITRETYVGLKISVNSIIEATQFLLQHEVQYVLTERFCQDALENYFGHQRAMGARKDNPSLRDFGYNDNTIRNQKIFRPIAGNVMGQGMVEISNDPVPCRKRARKE